jgi:hypothetical protein
MAVALKVIVFQLDVVSRHIQQQASCVGPAAYGSRSQVLMSECPPNCDAEPPKAPGAMSWAARLANGPPAPAADPKPTGAQPTAPQAPAPAQQKPTAGRSASGVKLPVGVDGALKSLWRRLRRHASVLLPSCLANSYSDGSFSSPLYLIHRRLWQAGCGHQVW